MTLIDFAADRRAPTPTAAAELAVPVRAELLATLAGLEERRRRALARGLEQRGQRLRDLSRALPRAEELLAAPSQRLDNWAARLGPALRGLVQRKEVALARVAAGLRRSDRVAAEAQRLDRLGGRLDAALGLSAERKRGALGRVSAGLRPGLVARGIGDGRQRLAGAARDFARGARRQTEDWRERLGALERLRQTLGYKETLRRGYAVVRGGGAVVTTRSAAEAAGALEIEFQDGRLAVGGGAGSAPRPRKPKSGGTPPEQGDLF